MIACRLVLVLHTPLSNHTQQKHTTASCLWPLQHAVDWRKPWEMRRVWLLLLCLLITHHYAAQLTVLKPSVQLPCHCGGSSMPKIVQHEVQERGMTDNLHPVHTAAVMQVSPALGNCVTKELHRNINQIQNKFQAPDCMTGAGTSADRGAVEWKHSTTGLP